MTSTDRQRLIRAWLLILSVLVLADVTASAQGRGAAPPPAPDAPFTSDALDTAPVSSQLRDLRHAYERLPLATALACVLALRPRRKGTPPRRPPVIQTQIILAVIGALVMLVVGSSIARAFGIVGAAGLVRYRAKIEDPKDAGVMLSTLAVGLACGVGQWLMAIFGTVFIVIVLWVVESFEPKATRLFNLVVKTKDTNDFKPKLEALLKRQQAKFEIRAVSNDELHYELRLPLERNTNVLSESIVDIDRDGSPEVVLEVVKDKA